MKRIIIGYALLALVSLSCRTTIPNRDTVAPTFLFHIIGTGLNAEITETFDFDNSVLYLKRGEAYNVIYSGNDPGGLENLQWIFPPSPAFRVPNTFTRPCSIRNIPSGELEIECSGDRGNPLTGLVATADLFSNGLTPDTIEEFEFYFFVRDFKENSTFKELTVRISNEGPRIGPR